MGVSKCQVLSLALGALGAVLVGVALFEFNENTRDNWVECDFTLKAQGGQPDIDIAWTFGLVNNWMHDNTGTYLDARMSNCGSDMDRVSSFINTAKVCEMGKLMLGLGICSLILGGISFLVSIVAIFRGSTTKLMLASSFLSLVAALFAGLGVALYMGRKEDAFPNITTNQGSIRCKSEAGPLSLVWIGAIFQFFACLLFCPTPLCRAAVESGASPATESPQSPHAIAFTTMSSDRDAFE